MWCAHGITIYEAISGILPHYFLFKGRCGVLIIRRPQVHFDRKGYRVLFEFLFCKLEKVHNLKFTFHEGWTWTYLSTKIITNILGLVGYAAMLLKAGLSLPSTKRHSVISHWHWHRDLGRLSHRAYTRRAVIYSKQHSELRSIEGKLPHWRYWSRIFNFEPCTSRVVRHVRCTTSAIHVLLLSLGIFQSR